MQSRSSADIYAEYRVHVSAGLRLEHGLRLHILQAARDIERFGAEGITVHPRPDERHIRYQDVRDLKAIVTTELNVEGNPTPRYLQSSGCEA